MKPPLFPLPYQPRLFRYSSYLQLGDTILSFILEYTRTPVPRTGPPPTVKKKKYS